MGVLVVVVALIGVVYVLYSLSAVELGSKITYCVMAYLFFLMLLGILKFM